MGIESIVGSILTIIALILTAVMKRKDETRKDTDAVAVVEADELNASLDRLDKLPTRRTGDWEARRSPRLTARQSTPQPFRSSTMARFTR